MSRSSPNITVMQIEAELQALANSGNLRSIPVADSSPLLVDLSSNDYLGLASDVELHEKFFAETPVGQLRMGSSASRLLGACQSVYSALEADIASAYGHGRAALLFNSGYHANVGLVSALSDASTLIVADRLVHASIIDGIKLGGAQFVRFRHNDYDHLKQILETKAAQFSTVLIIAESVYSMDGDRADTARLASLKALHPGALLYIDEAHAVGVCGPAGLGVCARQNSLQHIDILVGTMGKALASSGAFAVMSPAVREFMVNKARPLIFSTALSPAQVLWSRFVWNHALGADSLRDKLGCLCRQLALAVPGAEPSHIRPLIMGSADRAVQASRTLLQHGYKVLPIRRPTVPPGTERLRFSLSADIDPASLQSLASIIKTL